MTTRRCCARRNSWIESAYHRCAIESASGIEWREMTNDEWRMTNRCHSVIRHSASRHSQYRPWNDCCGNVAARAVGGSGEGATTPALSTNSSASARGGVLQHRHRVVHGVGDRVVLRRPRRGHDAHAESSSTLSVGQRNRSCRFDIVICGTSTCTRWFGATVVGRSSFTGSIFSTWLSRSFTTASADARSSASSGLNSSEKPSSIVPISGW